MPAIHISRFMPAEPGGALHPSDASRSLLLPRPEHPDIVEEQRRLTIDLPDRYGPRVPMFIETTAHGNLTLPWAIEPRTGLHMPVWALQEVEWKRQWRTLLLITPNVLGLLGSPRDLAHVAWRVLRMADVNLLTRSLTSTAFRLEVTGPDSSYARNVAQAMKLPGTLGLRFMAAVRSGEPFFDPRCARWIFQEVAVAQSIGSWSSVAVPDPDDHFNVAIIERLLFPNSLLAGAAPPGAEVLRALWLLHDVFTHASPPNSSALDEALSLSGVLGYSARPRFGWLNRINQWSNVWQVPDDHPSILNNPSAKGLPKRPSDIRQTFADRTGVSITDWMTGSMAVACRYFVSVGNEEPHISERNWIANKVSDHGRLSSKVLDTVENHLVADVDSFGRRLCEEMSAAGISYTGLGSTPTYDARTLAETPIVSLSDDGAWAPIGLGLLVDRIVELPRSVAFASGEFGDHRRLGGLVGFMFEAVIADLLRHLGPRHSVLTEHQIVDAVGSRAGGDGLIGYVNDYLVVEASVQRLGPEVAQGSPEAIRSRCEDYHGKADQAERTLQQLNSITRFHDLPLPAAATSIVVTDIPLTLNPATAAALRQLRPDRPALFVCSLEEFEGLLQLGDIGWGIPAAVITWQSRGLDVPLADQLEQMAGLRGADPFARFDLQDWFDRFPLEPDDVPDDGV